MTLTVLVRIRLADDLLARLHEHHTVIDMRGGLPQDAALDRVQAVVTNGTTGLSADWIARLPALRRIVCYGAGMENVDAGAAAARGIDVCNAPGLNSSAVADHAVGLALAIARDYAGRDRLVRAGRWDEAQVSRPTLWGATAGIVGIGHIGTEIARRLDAFGTRVLYHARRPRTDLPWQHCADLADMAARSDFLFLACPGGPATHHLVDRTCLAALGPEGFLVNVARGPVVDTQALIAALRDGGIAGAALDVVEGEPQVPEQLFAFENLILTPHMAGRAPEALRLHGQAVLDRLAELER